jgi:hypothetical protein
LFGLNIGSIFSVVVFLEQFLSWRVSRVSSSQSPSWTYKHSNARINHKVLFATVYVIAGGLKKNAYI